MYAHGVSPSPSSPPGGPSPGFSHLASLRQFAIKSSVWQRRRAPDTPLSPWILSDRARGGPLHLRRPEVAELMIQALLYGQDNMKPYQLHAWVVMANHIHVLLTPFVEISKIIHSLKRFTAREANRMLGFTGQPFWQDESYDHLVRDAG